MWARASDKALTKLTTAMAILGVLCLVLAVMVVVGDIIWRRIGGGSFIGAIDLTQFSVMAAVSWSIPFAFSMGGHVSVDLLTQSFSGAALRWLDCLSSCVGALLTGFLAWLSSKRALEIWSYGDVSQDLAIPMIWFWAFLVTGLATSALVCLVRALLFALSATESTS